MSHPVIPSSASNNSRRGTRSSAQRARGSWRACWPVPATVRTRRNASCRWRRPIRDRMSWRRWSGRCNTAHSALQAIARILAARSQPKTPRDVLAEDQRGHLPPGSMKTRVSPRPTSDYQGLLSEEPHDAETTDLGTQAQPPIEEPAGRRQRLYPACMTTSQPRCKRWGLRWLPVRSTRRCLRRRRNH